LDIVEQTVAAGDALKQGAAAVLQVLQKSPAESKGVLLKETC
jgi:hypothetical protein